MPNSGVSRSIFFQLYNSLYNVGRYWRLLIAGAVPETAVRDMANLSVVNVLWSTGSWSWSAESCHQLSWARESLFNNPGGRISLGVFKGRKFILFRTCASLYVYLWQCILLYFIDLFQQRITTKREKRINASGRPICRALEPVTAEKPATQPISPCLVYIIFIIVTKHDYV